MGSLNTLWYFHPLTFFFKMIVQYVVKMERHNSDVSSANAVLLGALASGVNVCSKAKSRFILNSFFIYSTLVRIWLFWDSQQSVAILCWYIGANMVCGQGYLLAAWIMSYSHACFGIFIKWFHYRWPCSFACYYRSGSFSTHRQVVLILSYLFYWFEVFYYFDF